MSWNYRVVRSDDDLRIYDVYYNEAVEPIATHVDPTYVYGESIEQLGDQLELMRETLSMPILDRREIGRAARALRSHQAPD